MRGRSSKLLLIMAGMIIFGCPLVAAFLARPITVSGGLQAEIQRIKSQGAPTSVSELRAPRLPRSMNAAPVYAAAAREMLRRRAGDGIGEFSAFCWRQNRNADPSLSSRVKALLPRFRRAISLADKASRMPLCRFPVTVGEKPVRSDASDAARSDNWPRLSWQRPSLKRERATVTRRCGPLARHSE